ncbi:MAG: family 20 glycosylhydrolase [Clostridia bacterium]|nr:family 20 glycosylhydrolase [Clostridia bacterium]
MLKLIPEVKYLEQKRGFLPVKAISGHTVGLDPRLERVIDTLPADEKGVWLEIDVKGETGEKYELEITLDKITLTADSPRGAFYGLQTLKQIFAHRNVPCLYISDFPDLEFRGYYHDVTRGKIPKVETLKRLIDVLAMTKHNVFQIYVEHVFDFPQYEGIKEKTGYYTADEIIAIRDYCEDNFIDFQPSLSCFGHLFALLEHDRYKYLRCHSEDISYDTTWQVRGRHHTIDPRKPESFELIKSLFDAYLPLFKSEWVNICCDETFDLKALEEEGCDYVELYVDFVTKIVNHVKSYGKRVMMWGDIAREHPEALDKLPRDVMFIKWNYNQGAEEYLFERFNGRLHIVGPSVCSQCRMCEAIHFSVPIIKRIIGFGMKYGCRGMLNTNWGDWGNFASIDMSLYGVVFGGAVAWDVETDDTDEIHSAVNKHIYKYPTGFELHRRINEMHRPLLWSDFARACFDKMHNRNIEPLITEYDVYNAQREYKTIMGEIPPNNHNSSVEMRLCTEAIMIMYEYMGLLQGYPIKRITSTREWLDLFCEKWQEKNKKDELYKIRELFEWLIDNIN